MPPLPKRKHSRARQGKRRAALKIANPALAICPNCGAQKLPHTVCPNCGNYRGRVVLVKKEKRKKKE